MPGSLQVLLISFFVLQYKNLLGKLSLNGNVHSNYKILVMYYLADTMNWFFIYEMSMSHGNKTWDVCKFTHQLINQDIGTVLLLIYTQRTFNMPIVIYIHVCLCTLYLFHFFSVTGRNVFIVDIRVKYHIMVTICYNQ